MKDIEEPHIEKKKRWPNLIAAAFVLASVGVATFLGWKSYHLDQTEAQLKLAIETQKQNLIELEEREQIGKRMRAAELLRKARAYRTNWSEALTDLNEELLNRAPIKFATVNFDSSNQVQVTGKANDFLTAAGFLVLVKRSDKFENAFISNISPASTATGQGVDYNFRATFNYVPDGKTGATDN